MSIAFNCPRCGSEFQVDDRMAGRQGQCPCGAMFTIPGGRRPAPSAPSAPRPRASAPALTAAPAVATVAAAPAPPVAAPAPRVNGTAAPPVEAPVAARKGLPLWFHLLPALGLVLAFLVLSGRDFLLKDLPPDSPAITQIEEPELHDYEPRLQLQFHDTEERVTLGKSGSKPGPNEPPEDRIPAVWEPSMRFGIVTIPDPRNPSARKKLTYDEKGFNNNTVIRLDKGLPGGGEWIFGERPWRGMDGTRHGGNWPGEWKERAVELGMDRWGKRRHGYKSVWLYPDHKVEVTQIVEIVPGAQTRVLDTCLVTYLIENKDTKPHRVGLRFMMDTYIGANDGVPYTIPGDKHLCDTMRDFNRPEEVPDFIQALEKEDLSNPGTVAMVQLRLGSSFDRPDRVTLGAWPNVRLNDTDRRALQEKTLWEVPVLPMKTLTPHDSAIVIYWNEKELQPGQTRKVGFAYGLGSVASSEGGGQLALSLSGSFVPGGVFTLTAYVSDPQPGQSLTLTLPAGFKLVEGADVQPVPALPANTSSRNSPVTWKIRAADRKGKFDLKVRSSTGVSQTQPVTIRGTTGIFD
jgi:hypothetical protein